jgi:hypothetical protein
MLQGAEASVAHSLVGLSFPVHIDITPSDSMKGVVAEVLSRTGRLLSDFFD